MQAGPHIMTLATKNFQLSVYDLSLAFPCGVLLSSAAWHNRIATLNNYHFKVPPTKDEARKIVSFFDKRLFQLAFERN